MRFLFTMNMGSFKGGLVHQVIADHHAKSEAEMCSILNDFCFILVDQFYNMNERREDGQDWQYKGKLILNTAHIGKAQTHSNNPPPRGKTEDRPR